MGGKRSDLGCYAIRDKGIIKKVVRGKSDN